MTFPRLERMTRRHPEMPDETLLMLLDEVRHRTLRLLDGLTDAQARWTPSGLHNSILWHAGHGYILLEWFTMQALGAQPTCPEHWFETFSWSSRPAKVPADRWPPLEQVVQELRVQHGRIRKILSNLSDEELASSAFNAPEQTVRYRIVHALHDEACHSGEIWLLRKLQKLR